MTFLNNAPTPTTTVLPDFQYLTSPSGEQNALATTSSSASAATTTINHIPTCPIPKSVDCNQYGNNITNNNNNHLHHSNPTQVREKFFS